MHTPTIIKTPTDKYIFVGSLPESVLIQYKTKRRSRLMPLELGATKYKSPIFETEEDANCFFFTRTGEWLIEYLTEDEICPPMNQ